MIKPFKFNRTYLFLAILLFIVEILIALFVKDKIIRPYVGDFLVVILIYCFLKAFLNISPVKAVIAVLLFAYTIEILQYFDLVERIGLGQSVIARVVLGSSFEWIDIIAYTIGAIFILIVEIFIGKEQIFLRT